MADFILDSSDRKLLNNIFSNILRNPDNKKYHNLTLKRIEKRFIKRNLCLQTLKHAGFRNIGDQLTYNKNKLHHLQIIHTKISKSILSNQIKQTTELKSDLNVIKTNLRNCECAYLLNTNFESIYSNSESCKEIHKCDCLFRIVHILRQYDLLLKNKQDKIANIFGIIYNNVDYYDTVCLLDDFNHLIKCHSNNLEEIFQIITHKIYNNKPCDVTKCLLMRRNQRDRMQCVGNLRMVNNLYSSCDDRVVVCQELLDRIHCYFFHTFDIGYRMTRREQLSVIDDCIQTNNSDSVVFIRKRISKLFNTKQNRLRHVHDLNRIQSERYNHIGKTITANRLNKYEYGFRFFYWSYYKNKSIKYDDARCFSMTADTTKHEANSGYALKDLYIDPKYNNLKFEVLNNEICRLDNIHWNQLISKGECHISTIHFKGFKCARMRSAENYEMKPGQLISLRHVISMMIYCNYDFLQSKFTETYRAETDDSIEQIKKRHSNFYHLGKSLREIVECFGMARAPKSKSIQVYHGADKTFTFDSLFAFIKQPFSTTVAYDVAVGFAGSDGTILELNIDTKSWVYRVDEGMDACNRICCFNCVFISDFVHEAEIFCIGGINKFHFVDIHVRLSNKYYKPYIKGLKQMSTGTSHGGIAGDIIDLDIPKTSNEKQMVFRLLSHQILKCIPEHKHAYEFKGCPEYILTLMDSHCNDVKSIHFTETKHTVVDRFFRFKNGWIKLDLVTKVYPNVKHIQWYGRSKDISFFRSDLIYHSILQFIKTRNDNPYPRYSISIDPDFESEINEIIAKYEKCFKQLGWSIYWFGTDPYREWKENEPMIEMLFKDKHNPMIKTMIDELGINKMLSAVVGGSQQHSFNILEDYDKVRTLVIGISKDDAIY